MWCGLWNRGSEAMMNSKMARRLHSGARGESGSALVETAIMFPIFIAILLGAMELGDLAYKADEMTNAARSAAQYAAMNGGGFTDCAGTVPGATLTTCSTTRGMYATAKSDAGLVAQTCSSFTVQEQTSCTCSDSSGACSTTSTSSYQCASGRPNAIVSVYTSAQCSPVSSVPNLFPTGTKFTLTGYAQQEILQ
jgi:Flp pilus assembly protein TadG